MRGVPRSDASSSANLDSRAPARARTSVCPSAVAASGAPPITVAGRVQRPGSRSERSARPVDTSTRAMVVAAPAGVAVNSARQPAAGCPAGSARGAPAPSVRVRSAPARSTTRSPDGTGAAACSPHPAASAAAARMREAASGRMHPGYTPGARWVPVATARTSAR